MFSEFYEYYAPEFQFFTCSMQPGVEPLCHGVSSSEVMTRLILVLDEASGLPVWYDIIPGNVLDINTVMIVVNDVADSLGIEIDSLVLDAGYVSKDLVEAFHIGTEKTVIGRMPARRGCSSTFVIIYG